MSPSGTSSFDFHQDLNPSNSVPQVRLRPVVLVAISCRRDEGKSDTPHALVRPCKYACLPACLPGCLPVCLSACTYTCIHVCIHVTVCLCFVCIANPSCGMQSGIHPCEARRKARKLASGPLSSRTSPRVLCPVSASCQAAPSRNTTTKTACTKSPLLYLTRRKHSPKESCARES